MALWNLKYANEAIFTKSLMTNLKIELFKHKVELKCFDLLCLTSKTVRYR